MVDMAVPRTPTPASRTLRKPNNDDAPPTSVALTPPASGKKHQNSYTIKESRDPISPTKSAGHVLAPKRFTPSSGIAMPSPEDVQDMTEEQLRGLANDLIPSLGEARMELAHTKLQYQLLAIETREAAERAEVEHEMTRKEVEVLQAGSPIMQGRALITPDPRSTLAQIQYQLETAILRNQELEVKNQGLDIRLSDAKRLIKVLDGRNVELSEHNQRLRERIRDNREHLNAMRASGLLRSAPASPKHGGSQHAPAASHSINHYATPARPRRPTVQRIPATPVSRIASTITPSTARPQDDPFGALLFAGEVLDAHHQRASVPSTPSPTRTMRQPPTHTRGTHSLSSLPVTPRSSQIPPDPKQTPSSSQRRNPDERRHSVSTISDSSSSERTPRVLTGEAPNIDDAFVADDDMPASQASRAASDLLRRYPGPSSQDRPSSGQSFVQTKLTGSVVKNNKRSASGRKSLESPKKQKKAAVQTQKEVGLGIGMWPTRDAEW